MDYFEEGVQYFALPLPELWAFLPQYSTQEMFVPE